MQYLALPFLFSLIATLFILRFQHVHGKYTADHDLKGVQKFHASPVPRIGGLGVMIGMISMLGWLSFSSYFSSNIIGLEAGQFHF